MKLGFYFEPCDFKDVYIIENCHFGDYRGSFTKSFEKDAFTGVGIEFYVSEIFTSVSSKNVVRGLHFQLNHPQAKLVTVLSGAAWDVIVDLRPDSKTYKKWFSIELTENNHKGIYVPRGFAHGFASLTDNTIMQYACDGRYDAETDTGIQIDDPEIGIGWVVSSEKAVRSKRDLDLPSFAEYVKNPMRL